MNIVLLPDEIIALNAELATEYHPTLAKKLESIGGAEEEFIERFATIAAHVGVALDGLYTPNEMLGMIHQHILPRLIRARENPHGTIYLNSDPPTPTVH